MGREDVEKYFFMGLVHDIGKPLLVKLLIENSGSKFVFDIEEIIPAIQEVHTSFGAMCLKQWAFRKDFVSVAQRHEETDPGANSGIHILIIHLANKLCSYTGHSLFENDTHPVNCKSAKLLKIDIETLDVIAEEVRNLMLETSASWQTRILQLIKNCQVPVIDLSKNSFS